MRKERSSKELLAGITAELKNPGSRDAHGEAWKFLTGPDRLRLTEREWELVRRALAAALEDDLQMGGPY
jgi:hypothetical protein